MCLTEGPRLFEYLSSLSEPLRIRDFHSHTRALGFSQFRLPLPASEFLPFQAAAIRSRGECVGNIYLAGKNEGQEFTPEDEEILIMFASQAAMVIVNARRHRDEQRARLDLETLINTSARGRRSHQRQDGSSGVGQPGGEKDLREPDGTGPTAGRAP